MLTFFLNTKKFIPYDYVSSIFDIDYNKLYSSGKRLILTDLDNTLISYLVSTPNEDLFRWKEMLNNMGFEIIIVSNSRKHRVEFFAGIMGLKYQKFAKKPLTGGFRRAMKSASKKYTKEETIVLGDQLMTDIYGASRYKLDAILVKAVDKKTEFITTRINRRIEKRILKKIFKKYPLEYESKLKRYESENK